MQNRGCPKVGWIIALDRFTIGRCEVLGGDRKLGREHRLNLSSSGRWSDTANRELWLWWLLIGEEAVAYSGFLLLFWF